MIGILHPIAPDRPDDAAMAISGSISRALQAELVVLQVREQPSTLPELARLYTLTAPLRDQLLQPRLRVRQGDPAARICQEAAERRSAWIILGAGGDGRNPGPVASAVFQMSQVPVVLVRQTPTLRPAVDLHFQHPQHAIELLGRIRAAGERWERTAPNRVRAALDHVMLSPAI